MSSLVISIKFKDKKKSILHRYFQKKQKKVTLPNSYCETSINYSDTTTGDKYNKKKKNRATFFMNIDAQILYETLVDKIQATY